MSASNRVILFVIDGLRSDGLAQAHTPTMDALAASGAYAPACRTVMPSITLPCHASMFLSVPPERHGVVTNTWAPGARDLPGLFDVVHQAGRRTASFYNWEELRDLSRPGSLDTSFYLGNCYDPGGDAALAALAAGWLRDHPVDLAFVYLGYTDSAGHAQGWMSDAYLRAVGVADRCIGGILDGLDGGAGVVVTSDHGGHGRTHGADCDEDMLVPLIVNGPTVPAGTAVGLPVSILDIAPTVAAILGVEAPAAWAGRPICLH
jgi:predicted AlkP superfamily pyrophosphatase or phosphodiesterase